MVAESLYVSTGQTYTVIAPQFENTTWNDDHLGENLDQLYSGVLHQPQLFPLLCEWIILLITAGNL